VAGSSEHGIDLFFATEHKGIPFNLNIFATTSPLGKTLDLNNVLRYAVYIYI
jgi:hypothetical protein